MTGPSESHGTTDSSKSLGKESPRKRVASKSESEPERNPALDDGDLGAQGTEDGCSDDDESSSRSYDSEDEESGESDDDEDELEGFTTEETRSYGDSSESSAPESDDGSKAALARFARSESDPTSYSLSGSRLRLKLGFIHPGGTSDSVSPRSLVEAPTRSSKESAPKDATRPNLLAKAVLRAQQTSRATPPPLPAAERRSKRRKKGLRTRKREAERKAAERIQAVVRGFLARREAQRLRRQAVARAQLLQRLVTSERKYHTRLATLQSVYLEPMVAAGKFALKSLEADIRVLLGYSRIFLQALEARAAQPRPSQPVGDIFKKIGTFFKTYVAYCNSYKELLCRLGELNRNAEVQAFLDEAARQTGGRHFYDYLWMPINRVAFYFACLKEFKALTDASAPDRADLDSAGLLLSPLITDINASRADVNSITHVLVMQSSLLGLPENIVTRTRQVLQIGTLREPSRHVLVLFNDLLVLARPLGHAMLDFVASQHRELYVFPHGGMLSSSPHASSSPFTESTSSPRSRRAVPGLQALWGANTGAELWAEDRCVVVECLHLTDLYSAVERSESEPGVYGLQLVLAPRHVSLGFSTAALRRKWMLEILSRMDDLRSLPLSRRPIARSSEKPEKPLKTRHTYARRRNPAAVHVQDDTSASVVLNPLRRAPRARLAGIFDDSGAALLEQDSGPAAALPATAAEPLASSPVESSFGTSRLDVLQRDMRDGTRYALGLAPRLNMQMQRLEITSEVSPSSSAAASLSGGSAADASSSNASSSSFARGLTRLLRLRRISGSDRGVRYHKSSHSPPLSPPLSPGSNPLDRRDFMPPAIPDPLSDPSADVDDSSPSNSKLSS